MSFISWCKKSKIGVEYFDFDYDESKYLFDIHIKGQDFGFIIERSKNDIDYFIKIQGDALRGDDRIDTRGDFYDVENSFADWFEISADWGTIMLDSTSILQRMYI